MAFRHQQLQQAQEMEAIGRLVGGITHEFNNLLLAISGNAELLQQSPTLGPQDQDGVREILGAARRAADLTSQLLALSQPQADELGSVDLNSTAVVPPLAGGGSERILLVEDELSVRAVVAKMLTAHGYDVVAAEDPIDALDMLALESYATDLVVSDLVMPKLTGVEFAKQAETLRPGIRFLFISGYSGHRMLDDSSLQAHVQLVQKPFTGAELTQAVRQALDAPAETGRLTVDA